MKPFSVIGTSLLSLMLVGAAPSFSQEDKAPPQENPPAERSAPEEHPQDQQRPEARPEQPEARPEAPQDKGDQEQKQEQKQDQKEDKQQQKDQQKDDKAQQKATKNAKQQPVHNGGRIPDDQFRAHFGRAHTFHIGRPVVVNNSPRFQYSGYTFVIVDAWPVGWDYADEFYIDYIDGAYFLYDPLHPGVQIALTVVL